MKVATQVEKIGNKVNFYTGEERNVKLILSSTVLVTGKEKVTRVLFDNHTNANHYLIPSGIFWDQKTNFREQMVDNLASRILIKRNKRTLGLWFYGNTVGLDKNVKEYCMRYSYPFNTRKQYGVRVEDYNPDIPEFLEIYLDGKYQGRGLYSYNEGCKCWEITFVFTVSEPLIWNVFFDYNQGIVPPRVTRFIELYRLCDLNIINLLEKEKIIAGLLLDIKTN